MTKQELIQQKLDIERQLEKIEVEEKSEKKKKNKLYLDELRKNKELILSLVKHGRTSCSDENPINGYGTSDYGARCTKCHLIEILDEEWEDRFSVTFDVYIDKV